MARNLEVIWIWLDDDNFIKHAISIMCNECDLNFIVDYRILIHSLTQKDITQFQLLNIWRIIWFEYYNKSYIKDIIHAKLKLKLISNSLFL